MHSNKPNAHLIKEMIMKLFSANNSGSGKPGFGKLWLKAGLALAIAGSIGAAGLSMASDSPRATGHMGHHGMSFTDLLDDSVILNRIVDKVVDRVVPDGSAQQKTSLATIVKAAMQDLRPLHQQNQLQKQQISTLLQQPAIDRGALEQWRQDELRLADTASKRILQAVADCAEILTPQQRVELADHLKQHHG
jgi:hypothetical protein